MGRRHRQVSRPSTLVDAKDIGKRYGDFVALHPLDVGFMRRIFGGLASTGWKIHSSNSSRGTLCPSIGRIEVLGIDAVADPQHLKANIGIVPESESPPSFLTPPSS
ncbi:MAG: hypothetical protein CM15mP128_4430 [Methanobacteriota archaeon]|nr:MAG: hypothetical protein CM15mP128_4430 [Euryarchaeota archaeon]